jgi:hypothetical protein
MVLSLRQPNVRVFLVLVALAAVFAGWAAGANDRGSGSSPAARGRYVSANVALLAHIPELPGARPTGTESSGYRRDEDNASSPIAGYDTTRSYELPQTVTRTTVFRFFRRALAGTWRLLQLYPGAGEMNFQHANAYLEISVHGRELDVAMDHAFCEARGAPSCSD